MLFDTNDVTVSMVPAPRIVHLVAVACCEFYKQLDEEAKHD